ASIAFVRRGGQASVEVWLADRVSGKVMVRALALPSTSDAASVLAIRAVDLLRASFREFEQAKRPPPQIVGVDTRPVPAAVAAHAEPLWSLRVEGAFLLDRPALGAAFGPCLAVSRRVYDRIDVGVALAGPLLGAEWTTGEGAATVQQQFAWLELRWHLLESRA